MKRGVISSIVALSLLGFSGCKVASNDDNARKAFELEPGQWDIKYAFDEIDVPGLSGAHRERITAEISKLASGPSCLSSGLTSQPNASFFAGAGTSGCEYSRYDVSGGKATIKMSCNMKGFGTVEIDHDGPIAAGDYRFQTKAALRLPLVGRVVLRGESTGRRSGPCPKP